MLGMLYGENGKYGEAIEPLERAAELDPDSFEIYHNIGFTYFRLRRFAEARAPLEKAVSLRPDYFGSNALCVQGGVAGPLQGLTQRVATVSALWLDATGALHAADSK